MGNSPVIDIVKEMIKEYHDEHVLDAAIYGMFLPTAAPSKRKTFHPWQTILIPPAAASQSGCPILPQGVVVVDEMEGLDSLFDGAVREAPKVAPFPVPPALRLWLAATQETLKWTSRVS